MARRPKRELISRTYNLILRTVLATRVRDAQCGFKAVRADVARRLLPAVEDDGWFFDTELLLLAEHNGLRIHEVPVDWIDDADSRVHVARTALDDLRGHRRAWRARSRPGAGTLELGATARPALDDDFGRSARELRDRSATLSTLVSLVLFLLHAARARCGRRERARGERDVRRQHVGERALHRRVRAGPHWRSAIAVYLGSLAFTSAALLVGRGVVGGGLTAELAVARRHAAMAVGRVPPRLLRHAAPPTRWPTSRPVPDAQRPTRGSSPPMSSDAATRLRSRRAP